MLWSFTRRQSLLRKAVTLEPEEEVELDEEPDEEEDAFEVVDWLWWW